MRQRLPHAPRAVLAALVIAALVNVAQYPNVESGTRAPYRSLSVKPDHDIRTLVERHFSGTRREFGLYAQLRDLAPGSTIVAPPEPYLQVEYLLGLAMSSGDRRTTYDPSISSDTAHLVDLHVVATGQSRGIGEYAIALGTDTPTELVLLVAPDRVYFVASVLLNDLGINVLRDRGTK